MCCTFLACASLAEQIKVASRLSGVATASMGKFDRQLKGEKPGERSLPGKRRKYMAVTDTKTEHNKVSGALDVHVSCSAMELNLVPRHNHHAWHACDEVEF
jgi:hypothetical protein